MAVNQELENLKKSVAEKATEEASANNLNEQQAKLFVDEAVKKAVAEYKENKKAEDAAAKEKKEEQDKTDDKVEKKEVKAKKEKEYIVHTPVENFNGEVAGVQFAYGKAKVRAGWVLNWFKEHGYKVEEASN